MGQPIFVLTHEKQFKTLELLFYELKFCIQMFDFCDRMFETILNALYLGYLLMERYLVTHPTIQNILVTWHVCFNDYVWF